MTLVKGSGPACCDSNLGPDLPVLIGTKVYANHAGRRGLRRVVLGERGSPEVNTVGGGPKGTSEHLPDRFLCAEHSEDGAKGANIWEPLPAVTSLVWFWT